MKSRDLVHAIEASYAVDTDMQGWLDGVHAVLGPLCDRGLGSCAYHYDLSKGGITLLETAARNPAVDIEAMRVALTTVTDDYVDDAPRSSPCGMASEIRSFEHQPSVKEFFRPAGVGDIFVINAIDPAGVGVMFGAFYPTKLPLKPRVRATFSHVAAHMAAGYRLRKRLASANAAAAAPIAVMTPAGRLVHAEGDAKLGPARTALADAAKAIDHARGGLRRRDPDAAVKEWRALVSARWSLVDQFESDGKRYVVAKSNAPNAPDVHDIPARERQVLTYAALGHHNKLIAYELGLAASTVRVLLMRAAKRLGTTTRPATIAAFMRLSQQPS